MHKMYENENEMHTQKKDENKKAIGMHNENKMLMMKLMVKENLLFSA